MRLSAARLPLDHDAFDLVERDRVRRPVVHLRRLRRRVAGDPLRVLERPPVRQVRRDPRRPKRVAARRRRLPCGSRPHDRSRVHPRPRGGARASLPVAEDPQRSIPARAGASDQVEICAKRLGSIPARAGASLLSTSSWRPARVHPRYRGAPGGAAGLRRRFGGGPLQPLRARSRPFRSSSILRCAVGARSGSA